MADDPLAGIRYFVDENLLGFHKLLSRTGRDDAAAPGDPRLPSVPLGALDLDWMPVVALAGLIVITRDRRIRSRPAELDTFRALRVRSVWLGGKRDLSPRGQLELFLRQEGRIQQFASELGAGPWILSVTSSRVQELHVRA